MKDWLYFTFFLLLVVLTVLFTGLRGDYRVEGGPYTRTGAANVAWGAWPAILYKDDEVLEAHRKRNYDMAQFMRKGAHFDKLRNTGWGRNPLVD